MQRINLICKFVPCYNSIINRADVGESPNVFNKISFSEGTPVGSRLIFPKMRISSATVTTWERQVIFIRKYPSFHPSKHLLSKGSSEDALYWGHLTGTRVFVFSRVFMRNTAAFLIEYVFPVGHRSNPCSRSEPNRSRGWGALIKKKKRFGVKVFLRSRAEPSKPRVLNSDLIYGSSNVGAWAWISLLPPTALSSSLCN